MKQYCLIICHPNIGLLDNILPIMYHNKNYIYDILFYGINTMNGINNNYIIKEELLKRINNVFLYNNSIYYNINKLILKLNINYKYIKYTSSFIYRKFDINNYDIIIYDEYIHKNNDVSLPDDIKIYCLSHALNLKKNIIYTNKKNIIRLYYSNINVPENNSSNNNIICGIPRHESEWINYIYSNYKIKRSYPKNIIVLYTRPSNTKYYIDDRTKIKYLNIILEYIQNNNYYLIIKMHPGEVSNDVYKKIFGKINYKKNWEISPLHPLMLAKISKIAITFYSGIAIDLAYMNIPSIECNELYKMKYHVNNNEYKLKNGHPVSPYVYYSIIEYADTTEKLKIFLYKPHNKYNKHNKYYKETKIIRI